MCESDLCCPSPVEESAVGVQMKSYIGCKIIKAIPMSSYEFNTYRGIRKEDSDNQDGYLVKYPDGYESWSPKHVFEEAYREVSDKEKQLIIF